jgi:uncharacterized protein YjbJ (UPF0337 family)
MDWDRVEGNWTQFRGKVQKHWNKLTEEDLNEAAGRREELAARIQKRYGLEKAAAHREIEDWMKEPGVLDDWNDRRPILDM